jgi:subtilisin
MKKTILAAVLSSICCLVAGSGVAAAPPAKAKVLIGFVQPPGLSEQALVKAAGGDIKYTYDIIPAIAASVPENAIPGLLHNPRVTIIEPEVIVQAIDAELDNSWGVKRIGAGDVQALGNNGSGISVAIIDTGLDYNNPEFAGRYAGGYDFVNGDTDPMDDHGHGTHVAGIIAAADNGTGVVGVAPGARIYALKVLDQNGSGSSLDIIAALDWICGDYGNMPKAIITNNSYGSTSYPGTLMQQAFDFSASLWGLLNIAAAGNSGNSSGTGDNVEYPASFSSVVAVAATDINDSRANFSCTGPAVELAAPGVAVTSTVLNGAYQSWSGTSMASPHVAGTAALVMASGITDSSGNGFINDEIRARLTSTAKDLGVPGRDVWYGWGLVDAAAAAGVSPPPPPPVIENEITVSSLQTGVMTGRGRNKVFEPKTVFSPGDDIVVHATIVDSDGHSVAGAAVTITVTPENRTLTTSPSGSDGIAVATWQTQKNNKKNPGTPAGSYTVTVAGVTAAGYTWDGNMISANFTIQ